MSVDMTPCDLHEIWPCATCNGDDKRLDESTKEPERETVRLGGGRVEAKWPGRCKSCGRAYDAGEVIFWDDSVNGFAAEECCADMPRQTP